MSNQRVVWLGPDDPANGFPAVSTALTEPDGLLAAGGDLSTKRLLYAYRHGIFPWYDDGQPLLWWSPDPRCGFLPGNFHASRRLRREVRRCSAEIRIDTAFSTVIRECAAPRRSEQGTWITSAMIEAFEELHTTGWAHSVEVWQSDKLVGGLYGLSIGKVFFGESMFSQTSNASKIALMYLTNRLNAGDFDVLDCQVVSSHLLSLGASIIPRDDFIHRIESGCDQPPSQQSWPNAAIPSKTLMSRDA